MRVLGRARLRDADQCFTLSFNLELLAWRQAIQIKTEREALLGVTSDAEATILGHNSCFFPNFF